MASIITVTNETRSSASRITNNGRKITYQLNVIQQPERARACGSGAKSSADRRPVDPPPIVELRVYEGDAMNEITFSYNSNFFLFATLENARTIAQGRVASGQPSFPVLAGACVSGMVYLDRPSPAAYFIFPDLSVRHEGKYRLSFALYEGLKDQMDMDSGDSVSADSAQTIDPHIAYRLDVKSTPFIVYSAKKFPGLTESTALSRMVAEQGCRVRIRRDVRMRRREGRPSKEWEEHDDEAYERAGVRTATPDTYGQQSMATSQPLVDGLDRPRSVSNASKSSFAPQHQRRPSIHELPPGYQPGYQHSYHAPPPPPQHQPVMPPPQQQYQPGVHSYTPQQSASSNSHSSFLSNTQYNHPSFDKGHHTRYDNNEYSVAEPDYHRGVVAQHSGPQSQSGAHQYHGQPSFSGSYRSLDVYPHPLAPRSMSQDFHQGASSAQSFAGGSRPHALAPLKNLHPPIDRREPSSPSYVLPESSVSNRDPLHSQVIIDNQRTASQGFASNTANAPTSKRGYSSAFDTNHMEQPLRHGARPNVSHTGDDQSANSFHDNKEQYHIFPDAMMYRRADGTHRSRRVPLPLPV